MGDQSNRVFTPIRTLSTCTIVLLVTVLFFESLATTLDVAGTLLYPMTWNDAEAESIGGVEITMGLIMGLCGLALIASFIAAVVLVLMWMYRATSNLIALGSDTSLSPGWAVGYWFIPILNLYRPFTTMREIESKSRELPTESNDTPPSSATILAVWWATWIIGSIVDRISFSLAFNPDPALAERGVFVGAVGTALSLVAGFCLVQAIRRVSMLQTG